jgi:hypothetical protein
MHITYMEEGSNVAPEQDLPATAYQGQHCKAVHVLQHADWHCTRYVTIMTTLATQPSSKHKKYSTSNVGNTDTHTGGAEHTHCCQLLHVSLQQHNTSGLPIGES